MITSNSLNLMNNLNQIAETLESPEQMLGKGLNEPFSCSNSGARKNLYSTQQDHIVPLLKPEVPYVGTGYENRFGDKSSSIIKAKANLEVIAIIPKYSFAPKQHYFIIFKEAGTNNYILHERKPYEYTTESHGYLYNNSYVDALDVGDVAIDGAILRKSTSYDEYNNRMDGINLNCIYLATDKTMEDSVIVSKSVAEKMSTPLIKTLTIVFNDNDIPLNLYGDDNTWKSFPDIGEEIKNGIFCAMRRQKREEALFTQAYNRLQDIMISDDKYTLNGIVIDISVKANSDSLLDNFYNSQLKKYQNENVRVFNEITSVADRILANDPTAKFDYNLNKMVCTCRELLGGASYIKDDKEFTNVVMDVVVLEREPLQIGDKISDRYGGKGVVSHILDEALLPFTEDGDNVDVVINQSTCVNRLNPGQLFETSLTHVGSCICKYIQTQLLSAEESMNMIIRFMKIICLEEAEALERYCSTLSEEELGFMLDSIIKEGMVYLSLRPISDNMDIAKLERIYDEFPWILQNKIYVPQEDSNGKIRYITARRRVIVAKKYMHRLKQMSKDKFSSTSLSSTNIRNHNTRSKSSKNYKSIHSNTPIAQGNMEIDELSNLGMEYVVTNLMIHSVSPKARRLCEQMLTGDPFDINIQLDENSTNRSVEEFNAYMKTKGLRLEFTKVPKVRKSLMQFDIMIDDKSLVPRELMQFIDGDRFDIDQYYETMKLEQKLKIRNFGKKPLMIFDEEKEDTKEEKKK